MQGYLPVQKSPADACTFEYGFEDSIDIRTADRHRHGPGDIHRSVAIDKIVASFPGDLLQDFGKRGVAAFHFIDLLGCGLRHGKGECQNQCQQQFVKSGFHISSLIYGYNSSEGMTYRGFVRAL